LFSNIHIPAALYAIPTTVKNIISFTVAIVSPSPSLLSVVLLLPGEDGGDADCESSE
jgi:hypothetical protein